MSEHTTHNHGDMWLFIGIVLVMVLVVTWGTGSDIDALKERVFQLELRCGGGQR